MPTIDAYDKKAEKSITVYYETHGDRQNPAILLLHGWLCNRHFWEEFLVLAELEYYLIIPDMRGHGDTDYAKNSDVGSIAEDLNLILDAENIDKIILIGHSMGGLVSQAFYHAYPEKVIAMGLWDTGAQMPFGHGVSTTFYILCISFYIIGLVLSYPITPLFKLILTQGWKAGFKKGGKSDAYKDLVGFIKAMNKKSVLKAAFSLPGYKGIRKLSNIKVPVMLLHGKADRLITPKQLARKLDENIPNSKLYVVEGAAHFPPNEQPSEVMGYLKEFLSRLK